MKDKRTPSSDLEEVIPLLIGIWRRFHKLAGPADALQTREFRSVVAAVQQLQQGLHEGELLRGSDYFANKELLGSYLLYQWVIHYLQGLSLIGELPSTPRRILEVCSGPAPFAFAALRHGAKEAFAVDHNLQALERAGEIAGRYGMPLNVRRWDCHRGELPVEGKFDLIILGHCLEELFSEKEKNFQQREEAFIDRLLAKLQPTGFLLLVESSYPATNQRLLKLRDRLVERGIAIQAPCVWKGACPALSANNVCYAQREFEKPYLIKEIQRAAKINLSSLKMSYLIVRSPIALWPQLPDRSLYRIISPPVESYQGKRYYLCGTDGKKMLGSHLQQHPRESRAFDYLRRGELISLDQPLVTPHALDIVVGTTLTIEAACGKPLPEV